MKMVWSPEAVAELRSRYGSDVAAWRLVYDTEGCGCAVNGVPALWAVTGPEQNDVAAVSEPFALWHDPRQALFFDDTLHISYQADKQSFRLSSDGQIYTSRMVLADRRKQAAAANGRPKSKEDAMTGKIDEILSFNEQFVNNKQYEKYLTTRFPDKKLVIVTCMDTRLTELLPKAMNLRNGDAKVIKNAGAIITSPFGNIMRSIIVALYELDAHEVLIIGHHECGMTGIDPEQVVGRMIDRGIPVETIHTLRHSGVSFNRWLQGFDNVRESVENSVDIVRNHPLLPPGTPVHGLIIHPATGKLEMVVNGFEFLDKATV
jgi:carbonic anhydrase